MPSKPYIISCLVFWPDQAQLTKLQMEFDAFIEVSKIWQDPGDGLKQCPGSFCASKLFWREVS